MGFTAQPHGALDGPEALSAASPRHYRLGSLSAVASGPLPAG
jgi:hypothetical protein